MFNMVCDVLVTVRSGICCKSYNSEISFVFHTAAQYVLNFLPQMSNFFLTFNSITNL